MKFKSGDKVKFLNKKGGGYVTEVLANAMVKVVTESGFEYPVLENEIIKVDPQSTLERYFDEEFKIPKDVREKMKKKTAEMNKSEAVSSEFKEEVKDSDSNFYSGEIKLQLNNNGDEIEKGIILAYIPHDQNALKKSNLTISLINYTEYTVYFNFYLKKSQRIYKNIGVDKISPFSRLNLCNIEREELPEWLTGNFQAFFMKQEVRVVPNPVNTDIKLKLSYFDVNDNYRTSNVIDDKALMVMLNNIFYNEKLILSEGEKHKDIIIEEERQKDIAPVMPKQLIDRHKIGKHKAEVDLHISALREDYSTLKAGEILSIQKNYFIDALDSAMINNYSEVIFIHGIGNGVLKESIMSILRNEYDELLVRNAPFNQYGNGAIVVSIYEE